MRELIPIDVFYDQSEDTVTTANRTDQMVWMLSEWLVYCDGRDHDLPLFAGIVVYLDGWVSGTRGSAVDPSYGTQALGFALISETHSTSGRLFNDS